jgi:hypothetical protein
VEPRYVKIFAFFFPTGGPLKIFIISIRNCEHSPLIAGIRAKPELSRPEATFHGSTKGIIKKQKRTDVLVYENGTCSYIYIYIYI